MDAIEQDSGPIYGVRLIDSLPLGGGGMSQAMPTRKDLQQVGKVNNRTAAGYEVLLHHYRQRGDKIERMKEMLESVISGQWTMTGLQEQMGQL